MTTHITKTLKKISKDIAEEYAINWDYWESNILTKTIEKDIEDAIIKYEHKIQNFVDIDDLDEEQQYIINNLHIIERKNKIEEVIKTSM